MILLSHPIGDQFTREALALIAEAWKLPSREYQDVA